jgi:predicted phosphodiesterase
MRFVPGRRLLVVLLVVVAAFAGGLGALWSWSDERRLPSVGTIELSVDPFHHGVLDVYVPLLDWGVRWGGVRMPARLRVDVRTIDRRAAAAVAEGAELPLRRVRDEASDAIGSYLRALAAMVAAAALALGGLVAVALRAPRAAAAAVLVAGGWVVAVALLLAPRGDLDDPRYYARGSDIPVALRAVGAATRSAGALSEEVDSQLVGLARLVQAPARRPALRGVPRVTIASDLHNSLVALPTLAAAAAGGPVLFAGDLTDRGTPLESAAARRVVRTGRPFVFVPGNHDSDTLVRRLVRAGAVVLHQDGRLLPGGGRGPVIVRVAGLRVAGYASPNTRRAADGYRDRGAAVTRAEQDAFGRWLRPLAGRVDVVLVHEPQLAAPALRALRADPPAAPLLVAAGHTHVQGIDSAGTVAEVNGGTVGAGGTGNLSGGQGIGLAIVSFRRHPFAPLAADLVHVDPGSGAGEARRVRLDDGDVRVP